MIHLITGVPAAGKTLRAVHHITRYMEQGRAIYSNIDGLDLDGVLEAPSDWRDTPDGSVVVYDEAQQIYPPDGKVGRSSRPDVAAMEVHRHTGHDLILITQHPNLIHAHVRRLVGLHEHLTRAFGWGQAMIYRRDQAIRVDSPGDLRASETELWKHPKRLFELYKSASLHIEKKRVPRPLLYFGAAMIALVSVVVVLAQSVDFTDLGGHARELQFEQSGLLDRQPVHPRVDVPAVGEAGPVYAEAQVIAGCISSTRDCICYSEDGRPLDIPEAECKMIIEKPIRRRLDFSRSETVAQVDQPEDAPAE